MVSAEAGELVATEDGSPTIRRRELASRLRRLRLDTRRTIEDVAAELLCSPSKVSRMETGQRVATQRDIRDLCNLYGVDGHTREELMRLSREARQRSWWRQYSDLGDVTQLIDYQDGAATIFEYDSSFVPGLLQTEQYARAAIQGFLPRIREEILEERVEARMRRQSLLNQQDPPNLWTLLDESTLLRQIGGPDVLREQLEKLIQQARLPNVTIQVVPFRVGMHPGLNSAFSFVEFRDTALTPIIYAESLAGEFYLEGKDDISRYREAIEYMRAMALGPNDSLTIIREAAGHSS